MNSREDILAELNLVKAFLWQLWVESHVKIDKMELNQLKKEMIKEMRK